MLIYSLKYVLYSPYLRICKTLCRKYSQNRVRTELGVNLVKDVLETRPISSVCDWKKIQQGILQNESNRGQISIKNIDAMVLNYCITHNPKLGLSYFNFITKENTKLNLATKGKYLHLLSKVNENYLIEGQKCPEKEEHIILECYKNLRKEYPILDPLTLEQCIFALSLTSNWKRCLDILKEVEISSTPSYKCYSFVIAAAFVNNEHALAWSLLNDMLIREAVPTNIPFLTYINLAKRSQEPKTMLERLLIFLQDSGLICKEEIIFSLLEISKLIGLQGSVVHVGQKGNCKHCHQTLEKYDLTLEEFEELKTVFFDNVIIGRDVFLKTNPEELSNFKKFVQNMGKYDIVLDGLNVAFSAGKQPPQILSAMVAAVVSYFAQQNKKILLLGREHMNKWPMKNWGYVLENATVFLTQNISQDDPYLLYCALHSGKDTIVVTKDLMRSHKFRLKSPKYKALFSRWLSQRQYHLLTVNSLVRPIFRYPPPFNTIAQKKNNCWHIPYESTNNQDSFHKTWFCLKWR